MAGTASSSSRSPAWSETKAAPTFSSTRSGFVVPGIGMTQLVLREHPGERDLRRGRADTLGDRPHALDDRQVGLQRRALKRGLRARKSRSSNESAVIVPVR